jgi:hypothetical protein
MTKHASPVVANAYAVLPKEDKSDNVLVTAAVELARPALNGVTSPAYGHLSEARGLTWADDFFADEDDIVAVFDLDYENMESYYASLGWTCFAGTLCCPNVFTVALLGLVPCFLNKNVGWSVRAQHVAITRDGVRFVRDKRSTCWGQQCTDAGKSSKTVRSMYKYVMIPACGASHSHSLFFHSDYRFLLTRLPTAILWNLLETAVSASRTRSTLSTLTRQATRRDAMNSTLQVSRIPMPSRGLFGP